MLVIDRLFNARTRLAPRAALVLLLGLFALALAGCGTSAPSREPLPPRIGAPAEPAGASGEPVVDRLITPPHRAGATDGLVRVGLLLPFSSPQTAARIESASMLNAAQLALFETGAERLLLIPKDTGGTPDGARLQAREALREGADVILGPLFAEDVAPVVQEAAAYGKPVIAFSTDRSVAATGAYLLSITPEEEVARIVSFASRQGIVTFAALTPDSIYGQRVRDAADAAARGNGSFLVTWEVYPDGGDAAMIDPTARRLARYDGRLAARAADQEATFQLPYEAVILPEGGVRLLSLAPLLPFYDVDPRTIRFLGVSRWQDPATAREPSLAGGWFPGPDDLSHSTFANSYRQQFGEEPSRAAPMAYDGILAVASLTRGLGAGGLNDLGLQRSSGFRGADGLFRFGADRISQHAMAIYEIRNGSFVVIEPAPNSFEPQSF
jgi:ABC-type branched-subunit amino acid transport system substrate-binding protein